ncbi:membrane protein [Luteitalea sp. TBR-22]|uniref:MtrB/PioB family outer membrane beta-barrel protein n=1 Tax=Luteitalea sp. TBR-22 TaxID=2802971 RepID=UPI001AF0B958|nr:MtrB/PioB family outer membrane beta-barrel protein [Luteitalea sp. TBR-22]BCS32511.1 membrane protein [Luteitalea sp. TBR-22]
MTRTSIILALLIASPAIAQQSQTPAPAAPGAAPTVISGSVTGGGLAVDNDTNSAAFTQYRDLEDSVFLSHLRFNAWSQSKGLDFTVGGVNIGRDDTTLGVGLSRPGAWRVSFDFVGTPHVYSNKAVSAYTESSPGVLTAPATIPITFKKLATSAADTAGVLASDELIRQYQAQYLRPIGLETQNDNYTFRFGWFASDLLKLSATYDRWDKSGAKSTFGPIGDRPPRTLNVQLAEPVDYVTGDLTLAAEHQGAGYVVRGEYLYSDFENNIDTLRWQNLYTTAAPGADYDTWDRLVATSGARPLPPDNRYHNATASGAVDLPAESRLSVSGSFGRMEQNQGLLPYAVHNGALAVQTLPRANAEALMHTRYFTADYAIAPVSRLQVRAFARSYTLDNDTPMSNWQYITSDTSNLNGTASYVNKRVNLPYGWDRQHGGVEATYRLGFWRSSLQAAYERENIDRTYREADTTEDVLRASIRLRPARWMTVTGRMLRGDRDGSEYEYHVPAEGYWYAPADANDNNNPQFTFDNHPDMRRYDVIDRLRRQYDVTVNATAGEVAGVTAYVRYRGDDFDSDVHPIQPLLKTGVGELSATTPGIQLGLLEDNRLRYGVDVFYQPTPRATFNAFLNYDVGTQAQRSLEFNENNKANPSAINTAVLGPWTRPSSIWSADMDDRTWSGGAGFVFHLVPDRVLLSGDYTVSLADVDIAYDGFGEVSFDGTPFPPNHEFFFTDPSAISEDLHAVNVRLEVPVKAVWLVVGYGYERYRLADWQQGAEGPWVEQVGADTLLRDTSRSFQWGNRLFNLGTYLAPSYNAHLAFVGLRYRF